MCMHICAHELAIPIHVDHPGAPASPHVEAGLASRGWPLTFLYFGPAPHFKAEEAGPSQPCRGRESLRP